MLVLWISAIFFFSIMIMIKKKERKKYVRCIWSQIGQEYSLNLSISLSEGKETN